MGVGEIKILREQPELSRGFSSDESDSVYVLVLPRVAPDLGRRAKTTCGAPFLPDVVGVTAAAATSDVSLRSAPGSKRGRALPHFLLTRISKTERVFMSS